MIASRGLVEIGRKEEDKRVSVITATELGIKVHNQVLLAAAKRLQESFPVPVQKEDFSGAEDNRRLTEATGSFRQGNGTLTGVFRVSLFDLRT